MSFMNRSLGIHEIQKKKLKCRSYERSVLHGFRRGACLAPYTFFCSAVFMLARHSFHYIYVYNYIYIYIYMYMCDIYIYIYVYILSEKSGIDKFVCLCLFKNDLSCLLSIINQNCLPYQSVSLQQTRRLKCQT